MASRRRGGSPQHPGSSADRPTALAYGPSTGEPEAPRDPGPSPIYYLDWDGETILGRSQISVVKGMRTVSDSQTQIFAEVSPLPLCPISVRVDHDADGWEIRFLDPMGFPFLEWRFEFAEDPDEAAGPPK